MNILEMISVSFILLLYIQMIQNPDNSIGKKIIITMFILVLLLRFYTSKTHYRD